MDWLHKHFFGILYTFLIALVAWWLGNLFPVVGGPVFGIVLGILSGNLIGKPQKAVKGIGFVSKKVLQWAIIILGAGLNLSQVWKTGIESLPVMLFTLTTAFAAAFILGKILGVPAKLKSLIGVGTAICGGSAIAAVSPIIEADEMEIAYSVSTIFLFNIMAVLIFPPLGHILGLSDQGFGLWAGTAINDTSSVVAAGYAFSNAAGAYATIVKLTRTTMIIPVSLIFAFIVTLQKRKKEKYDSKEQNDGKVNYNLNKIFPWFILWFLVASLLNTLGLFPEQIIPYVTTASKFMIVMALSAIGLNADLKKMLKTGFKPILLGLFVWLAIAAASLAVQLATNRI